MEGFKTTTLLHFLTVTVKKKKKIYMDPMRVKNGLVSYLINERDEHLYITALATLLLPCLEIHSFIITPLHIFAARIVK